ncbi:hypothetical protein [Maribacter aquivivus]|uniref:hypothetical protein n=1 Tax=Maribacter aquivivus TaxID=228958 RepID=UPI002490B2F7|nr:hypothetical protein [Maribacter aquivivus]
MKTIFIFLFCTISLFGQNKEFEDGQIIFRNGDTINVKIKVLNRFKSFNYLRYLDAAGKQKRILLSSIKSYSRGKEFFETLILSSQNYVLAKKIIQGPIMTLYYRDEPTNAAPIRSDIKGTSLNLLKNEYRYKYLKDRNQNILMFSARRAAETPFKDGVEKTLSKALFKNKRLKKFLSEYPEIVKKIQNKELKTIEEVVVECNNVNGIYWK